MTGSKTTVSRLLLTTALLAATGGASVASGDEPAAPNTAERTFVPSKVTNRLIFVPSEQPAAGDYPDPTVDRRPRTVRPTQKLDALKQKKQQTLDELHNKAARLVQAWKAKKALQEKAAADQAAADRERALQQKTAAERPPAELQHVQKSPQNPLNFGLPMATEPLDSHRQSAPAVNPTIDDPVANRPLANPRIDTQPLQPVIPEPLSVTADAAADAGQTADPKFTADLDADLDDTPDSSPDSETVPATVEPATVEPPTRPATAVGNAPANAPLTSAPATEQQPLTDPGPVLIDGPIDRMALATSLFATEQFAGCLKALEAVDQETLNGESRDWCQYMTACCLRKQGHLSDAESAYRKLLSRSETEWLSEAARWWLDHLNERHKLEDDLAQVNSTLDSWQKEIHALNNAN